MFRALLELPRPINCLITFLSVLLGGWLGSDILSPPLLMAAWSAALITGGGNTLNDLCGLTEDRINKPHRPLPSGRLSPSLARRLTVALLLTGLALSIPLPFPTPLIALIAGALLVFYNMYLKRAVLVGNLAVSALGGLAFLYGGWAVQIPQAALWPALFASLFHFGREILKDLEDCAGDRLLRGQTLPLRCGIQPTRLLITAIFTFLMGLILYPAFTQQYGLAYFITVCLLNILLLYVLIQLWRNTSPQNLRHLSHLLKAGMGLGLLAFFLDHL